MKYKGIMIAGYVLLLTMCITSQAYSEDNPIERLLRAKSLRCVLNEGYSGIWEDGNYKIEKGKFSASEKDSTSFYDSINIKAGTARIIGNQGASDVIVLTTPICLTFIEKTPAGSLMIMTVFAYYKRGTNEFVCVYSRHFGAMSQTKLGPMPSQWHGTCKIWE